MNIKEHLLVGLAEEWAKVQQAISKALLFGEEEGLLEIKNTNSQYIEKVFIEAIAVRDMLKEMEIISLPQSESSRIYYERRERVTKYIKFARKIDTFT